MRCWSNGNFNFTIESSISNLQAVNCLPTAQHHLHETSNKVLQPSQFPLPRSHILSFGRRSSDHCIYFQLCPEAANALCIKARSVLAYTLLKWERGNKHISTRQETRAGQCQDLALILQWLPANRCRSPFRMWGRSIKSSMLQSNIYSRTQPPSATSPQHSQPYSKYKYSFWRCLRTAMTVIQKQESGLVPMEANNPHDPPPSYSYTPLSPTTSSMPVTPATSPPLSPQPHPNAKTVLVPQPITPVPAISTVPRTEDRRPVMMNVLKERQPLSTCDSRFADLILTQAILPRLRVGVLKWKDRETFEYIPQTKDDVSSLSLLHCHSCLLCAKVLDASLLG